MLPEFACVFSAGSWSVASGVYKKASAERGVLNVNLLRCLVSVALGLIAVPLAGGYGDLSSIPASAWTFMALSGIMARLVGDTLFILSAVHIGVSRAMPIAAIYPVWSVLIGWLHGEPLSGKEFLALLVTLAGVILVIRSGSARRGSREPARADIQGFLLAFATSLAWALGLICTKWGSGGLDPLLVNLIRMSAGALALVLVLAFQRRLHLPPLRWGGGSLVGASALESWLASVAWVYGLTHTSTAVGSTLSSLAPVLSIPVAMFYLKEKLSPPVLAGIFLATAGVVGLVAH